MTQKTALILIPLIFMTGCRTNLDSPAYPHSVTYSSGLYPLSVGDLDAVTWIYCASETDAEIVLVLDLKPSALSPGIRQEFPLRRDLASNVDGTLRETGMPPHLYISAHGAETTGRGIGESVSFAVNSTDGNALGIAVSANWTSDQGRGQIKALIPSTIAVADEWALSDSARLKVSYRLPRKQDVSHAATGHPGSESTQHD